MGSLNRSGSVPSDKEVAELAYLIANGGKLPDVLEAEAIYPATRNSIQAVVADASVVETSAEKSLVDQES